MANFLETLKKPVGPLPLGAWLVVLGVGLGIAYYSWKHRGAIDKATDTEEAPEDVSGDAGVGRGGQQYIYQAPATVVGAEITDNDAWAKAAINYLIARGFEATKADQAIRRYLAGEKLSIQDLSLVNLALIQFGAPPTPLPPGPDLPTIPKPPATPVKPKPKPPAKAPAPKKRVRYVTVTRYPSKHGTLWGIAKSYYGNGALWPRIFNANRAGKRRADGSMGMIHNPNLIHAGWRLIVP